MPASKGQCSALITWWIIITVNPRTVQNMKTDMAKTHNDHVTKQLQQVNAVCTYTRRNIYTHTYVLRIIKMRQITHIFIFQLDCFMINLLDDYHNIHSKHVPTDLQKTKIAHMASSMLNIHPHIPAIKRTTVSPHRQVKVNIRGENKMCLGGADSCAVLLHIPTHQQGSQRHEKSLH